MFLVNLLIVEFTITKNTKEAHKGHEESDHDVGVESSLCILLF